jgi:hypothetical protein
VEPKKSEKVVKEASRAKEGEYEDLLRKYAEA